MATPEGSQLERVLHQLYGLDPAAFVAERDTLARSAKAAGDPALARAIGELRKPTQGAWLTNLLVRTSRDELAQLLELGAALRQAQGRLQAEELRLLLTQRRAVVASLVKAARRSAVAAGRPVAEDTAWDVETTLELALADAEVADRLLTGALVSVARRDRADPADVRAAIGWHGLLAGADPQRTGADAPTRSRGTPAARPRPSRVEPDRTETSTQAAAADHGDELARRRAQRRERAVAQARAHREQIQTALVQADAAAVTAEEKATRALHAERAVAEQVDETSRQVEDARLRLEEARAQLDSRQQSFDAARWARLAAEASATQAREAASAARQRLEDAVQAEDAVSADVDD